MPKCWHQLTGYGIDVDVRPTNGISIEFEIWSTFGVPWIKTQSHFARVTPVTLASRVQNVIVVGRICYEQEHYKISLNFEYLLQIRTLLEWNLNYGQCSKTSEIAFESDFLKSIRAPYERQLQLIGAWLQIWKLWEIYFIDLLKNIHLCVGLYGSSTHTIIKYWRLNRMYQSISELWNFIIEFPYISTGDPTFICNHAKWKNTMQIMDIHCSNNKIWYP